MKHSNTDRRDEIAGALNRLRAGNERFSAGLRSTESLASFARLKQLAEEGQRPFASILACADSRVPAELVFDCGLGDLFVCRLAGSVATPGAIASFEYAALVLETPLTVVIGHTRCGAVEAAARRVEGADAPTGSRNLERLIDAIEPAVLAARREFPGLASGEELRLICEENARLQRREILMRSPTLRRLRREGRWDVVSGVYDLALGRVSFEGDAAFAAGGAAR